MNNFFQTLRDIQKKERTSGTLSEIEDTFYDDASKYLNELLEIVNANPLSLESYQLREAQRITIEISERREFKIITSAITNVQKSHNLFKGLNKNSQLYDEIPYNTTPEEEKLYKDVIEVMIKHRGELIKEINSQPRKQETKIGFKPQVQEDKSEEFIKEEVPQPTGDNLLDIADVPVRNDSHKQESVGNVPNNKPKLDAAQVAQMFGQAPDDVLLDENNNPVETKSVKTHDMMAPFKPPEVPENDTVTLQNQDSNILDDEEMTDELSSNKPVTDSQIDDDVNTITVSQEDGVDSTNQETVVADEDLNDELFVEFIENLNTDILDEDEITYGPFNVGDMALLPNSIVRILKKNNVINII
ncbi:MAG: DNA replication complex GINS family protein [Methanosphaera stadtmanae]|nr:DNA replication complex GINS family protein [Methanosphaera stadtmanae]